MSGTKNVARVIAAVAVSTALAFACASCSVSAGSLDRSGGKRPAARTTMVMAAPAGSEEIGAYVDAVARLSAGSIQIELLSRSQTEDRTGLTGESIVQAVRDGEVPLALLPAREFDALGVSSLDALQAPFVIDSLAMEAELLRDDAITAPMLQEITELGVEGVAVLPGPLVHPFGISVPLLGQRDWDGATIAVGTGAIAARTLTLLGASPVVSDFNGASIDEVDGAALQLPAVIGNSYHAPGRSVTADIALWPRPLVVLANTDALAALTDEQRTALSGAAKFAIRAIVEKNREMDSEAADIGCGAGLSLPKAGRVNLDELRAAVRPVIDEIAMTETGAAVFARVKDLRQIAAQPLVCVADPANWPTEVSSRLDGTYVADTTPDDLRAQGVPEPDVVDENWGHWVLVVKDGRFALTQDSPLACTWAYGAWRMDDELIRMTSKGGGGVAPHGTTAKPGEDYVYHWTDFGDTLKLTLAMEDGPPDMAYTRVSDVPDVTAFPDRCTPPPEAFPTD